jgi:hypothetical protein
VFYGLVCQSLGWRELEALREREKEETRRTSQRNLKNETQVKEIEKLQYISRNTERKS